MKRVEIIYGGASNEKEISYLTAKSIYEHIDTDLYNPVSYTHLTLPTIRSV